jgi:hypothetical protein
MSTVLDWGALELCVGSLYGSQNMKDNCLEQPEASGCCEP